MGSTVSVRIGDSLLEELSKVEDEWKADRSEAIRRLLSRALEEWKLEQALDSLKEHDVSIGKAAEDAGVPVWEMIELAKEEDIDWTGYSKEDLEKDLAVLEG